MEEGRKKYVLDIFLKILWTSLTVLVVLGALVPMTIFLGWWRFLALCVLGLIAGVAITAGVSVFPRDQMITPIALALSILTIVALAVFLGGVAARNLAAFNIYNASLIPFAAYGIATVISGLIIRKTWRKKITKEAPAKPTEPKLAQPAVESVEEERVAEETKAKEEIRMP
ncbi:MAG: hypothetical protein WA148_05840 [Actinomycetota bacterium]